MGQVSLTLPTAGSTPNSTADPEIVAAINAIAAVINGNVDSTNLTQALATSAGLNTVAQKAKGVFTHSAQETISSSSYVLMPTPDQVQGIVLPSNGLIAVWFQGIWHETVAGAGSAAIFIGSNQMQVAQPGGSAPGAQAATIGGSTPASSDVMLASHPLGLASMNGVSAFASNYTGDVTTGQAIGGGLWATTIGGATSVTTVGGPCWLKAAAGTYTVSVQFKATSGSVAATGRELRVAAVSFS